jgi:hypothetical protein
MATPDGLSMALTQQAGCDVLRFHCGTIIDPHVFLFTFMEMDQLSTDTSARPQVARGSVCHCVLAAPLVWKDMKQTVADMCLLEASSHTAL